MSDTLEPCPFCGSEQVTTAPDREFGDITWAIICKACGASVARDLEEQAIAAWNTRTPPPPSLHREPIEADREALRKAAEAYEAFVVARNAMNAARPAIDATPAERALYDERYRADHAAEREHWDTAISLAQCARSILYRLAFSTPAASDAEGSTP